MSINITTTVFVPGILVIISLLFCTPYFYYIPKSALAAIIIAAVIFMVEIRVVKPIYRSKSKNSRQSTFLTTILFLHCLLRIFVAFEYTNIVF